MKQIKKLVEWGIITISDFKEKDKLELEHQIEITINGRTKTFRLCEDWFNAVSDLECDKIIESKKMNYMREEWRIKTCG